MQDAITVSNLSKKFDISKLKKETQFREALVNFAKRAVFRGRDVKEEIWALKNVSFKVEKGEIVGIVGRNGAGKSTLLKILSKITYPTSGRIDIQGRVGSLLEVGTGFHWELSGRENIYLNGSILGMKKKEVKSKLDAIVDFAEVERFLDTPIKYYSSGMRLKLGFSVAAHLDTDVLFVDEVLAVGDVAFQKKCLDTMKDLRNSGRTVIFVSHTMSTVENLCPRVLWFDRGELRQDGRSADVIQHYVSQFGETEPDTKFDLTEVPKRQGTGTIRYTGIEFLTPGGQPKKQIYCGDGLKVRLHYVVNEPISKPEFYFNLKTDTGLRVATFGTALSGHEIRTLFPGTGYIDVDIGLLPLLPDRYYLNLWINTCDLLITEHDTNHDGLENAATIEIKAPDPDRSGNDLEDRWGLSKKGIDKWWGATFVPCKWNFDGLNDTGKSVENA